MARIVIFEDRGRWKVRLIDKESGRTSTTGYRTEAEARIAAPRILREYERPKGKTWPVALEEYRAHLVAGGVTGDRPNRPRTLETTMGRLGGVFANVTGLTSQWTAARAETLWVEVARGSVDTRANTLKQCRTFLRWLNTRGWLEGDPLAKVRVVGARRRGKVQLAGVDEAARFLALAMARAAECDVGALACAVALVLGARASEVTERECRDLDANGSVLVIRRAKTAAGNRRIRIPVPLQGPLRILQDGKAPGDRLFGPDADRHWLWRETRKLCRDAGVTVVSPHGLRGTHATLAVEAGFSGDALAAALGHESFGTTARHYASADSVANSTASRFMETVVHGVVHVNQMGNGVSAK